MEFIDKNLGHSCTLNKKIMQKNKSFKIYYIIILVNFNKFYNKIFKYLSQTNNKKTNNRYNKTNKFMINYDFFSF